MNKAISLLKKIRLDRVLVVFLACGLLMLTTACNGAANAGVSNSRPATGAERARQDIRSDGTTGSISNGLTRDLGVGGTKEEGVVGQGSINESVSKNTELYDPIQPEEGGMNNFNQVDPRFDKSGADAKARQLIDVTQRNVIDQTDDVGTNTRRILDKKGENARDFGQDVKEGRGELKRQADETVSTARDNLNQAGKDASRNTRNAVNSASDAADNVDSRVKRNINRTQDAVTDAKGDVEDNVDKALTRTNRAINRATDSLE